MKNFFSIAIRHEYHQDRSNHLAIVPAHSNNQFIKNNQLWFRDGAGLMNCYMEKDESIKEVATALYFWVVCTDDSFFQYTDYPEAIRFAEPHYYWFNTEDSVLLQTITVTDKFPKKKTAKRDKLGNEKKVPNLYDLAGIPPQKVIGCIAIQTDIVESDLEFFVDFKVKRTLWEYRIHPKTPQKEWSYRIEDEDKEWEFVRKDNGESPTIIFQSRTPMAYFKRASDRLSLIWEATEAISVQQEQSMILPFANHAYRMVSKDNKELTPIYIHI